MTTLPQIIPDHDVLISLPPEKVGHALIRLVRDKGSNMFYPESLSGDSALFDNYHVGIPTYPRQHQREIAVAVAEGWQWLELSFLIMAAPNVNGQNGYKILTRRGARLSQDEAAFKHYLNTARLQKEHLHPALQEDVWLELAQGKYADAVFKSFRLVEENVRKIGNYRPEDVGVDLIRKAFDKERGPLARKTDPLAEREALAHLFAGALGSYKNPHSHRTVQITESAEAQEMVMLASHLLRILDARRNDAHEAGSQVA